MSSRLKLPARLDLSPDFPVAADLRDLAAVAPQARNWWYDVRRSLQSAIEGLRGDKNKFDTNAAAGTKAVSLGNAPATDATPYAWVEVIAPDGTPCVMPIWKKG